MTASLAKVDDVAEVQKLLDSPLTSQESQELEACELQVKLAGKTLIEQNMILGEMFNKIHDNALFRGEKGGGSWEDWINSRLPDLLPEAGSKEWVNNRRWFYEVRTLLHQSGVTPVEMPNTLYQTTALKALIPRRYEEIQAGWNPSDFSKIHALGSVWELACRNGVNQKRRNGPTREDVSAARDELRPALLEQGLIREMPKQFQQSAADRMAAAAASRQTVTAETAEQKAERQRVLDEAMAQVKASAPERAQQAKFNEVREKLERPVREHRQNLEDKVRQYNSKLISCYESIHDLLVFMQTLDRVEGTQYLQDMREIDVAGLITVRDDLPRLKGLGEELVQIVQLANSCNPPSGIDMTTVDV